MDMVTYALLFVGIPYVYGGNNPEQGFDCSGLVNECLRSGGFLDKTDLTAQGIYSKFRESSKPYTMIKPNTLLFFGYDKRNITHVAIAINGVQLVEASGEGRVPTNEGLVRVRRIDHRNDLVATINL